MISQSKAFWFPILNQLPWNVSMVCALSHVHTKVRLSDFSIFEIAIEVMPSPIISFTFDNKDIPSFFIDIWFFSHDTLSSSYNITLPHLYSFFISSHQFFFGGGRQQGLKAKFVLFAFHQHESFVSSNVITNTTLQNLP